MAISQFNRGMKLPNIAGYCMLNVTLAGRGTTYWIERTQEILGKKNPLKSKQQMSCREGMKQGRNNYIR